MVLSHGLLIAGMMHDAVTRAPSSRYDAVTPAPSSRYDAGSSEQVFCTWLIREWNFAYLHHIHTRESPSEYSEGWYWSTLTCVVLKFLSCLGFHYQTASITKLLVRWCRMSFLHSYPGGVYSSSVSVQEYPRTGQTVLTLKLVFPGNLYWPPAGVIWGVIPDSCTAMTPFLKSRSTIAAVRFILEHSL